MANEIRNAFRETFRDYVVDGVPSSGSNPVNKRDARSLGDIIQGVTNGIADSLDDAVTSLEVKIEGAAAGLVRTSTLAALNAVPGTRVGQPGEVTNDGANTGTYSWTGSAWVRVGDIFNEETAATFFDVGIAGVFKALRPRPSFENGAVANIGDANRVLGFTVPAGQTGQNTVLRYQLDIDDATAASLSNAQLQASFGFFLSATFDRTLNITINLWKKDGTVESITPTVLSNVVNGQFKVVTVEFASDVNTASIEFCATQSASSSVSSTQFAIMFNCMLAVASTTAVPATVNSENASAGARLQSLAAIADIGPVWDDAATVGFMFAGAQYRLDASGRAIGWTIPAGETGYNSLISVRIPVSESVSLTVQGSTIEWAFICRHSPGYSRGLTFVLANQEGVIATFMGRRQLISDTETLITATGIIAPGTSTLAASIQQATNTAAVSEEFLEIVDVRIFPVESVDPVRPPARLASFWANSRQRDLGLSAVDHATVVDDIRPAAWTVDVAAGASINAALTTENPPAKGRRRKLRLAAGQYAENRIFPKMYDGLIGAGPDLTVIDGSLSANSALANIANDSTIESYYDADYYGLFVRARNCRYAAHSDLPSELKDVVQRWRNCVLIHEGNQDAIDYQVSLGPSGNPEGVWPSTYAWGVGIWSGWSLSAENCVFIGGAGASGGHNNLNFSKPGRISFRNCTYLRSLTNPKTGFPVNGRGWTIRVTGKDPKGQWADQLGVVGNAVRLATLSADMVKDVKVPEEGKAKADVRDTGLIEVIKKPEAWGPIGGFLSAAGAMFAGSGPVQWALAALMIGGGILGFIYLVKRVRAA